MSTPSDAPTEPGGADWGDAPVELGATMGRYQLRRVVGAGGMGMVFEALDPELARVVAVKVLRASPDQDGDGVARLRREGQTMAQLAHPNVIRVYDVGVAHGHPFVAMEFIAGHTLAGWLDAAPRTPAQILAVFVQAGRGLAAAHAAGLVHRDFKPGNVLVGDDGRVLVTDFGLARTAQGEIVEGDGGGADAMARARRGARLGATVTATGLFVGTPAYMAPEQYSGEPVDARADQFSLCVALWRALYGTVPYAGAGVDELIGAAVANRLVPPPATTARAVPPAIRAALERGLRGDPDERFASIDELLAALTAPPRRRIAPVLIAGAVVAVAGAAAVAWAIGSGRGGAVASVDAAGADAAIVRVDAAPSVDAPPVADAAPSLDATPAVDARKRHTTTTTTGPTAATDDIPIDLRESSEATKVFDRLVRRAYQCGPWTTADEYSAQYEILPDGSVKGVDVTGPDPEIAACMKRMVVKVRFPRSIMGGGNYSSGFTRK